MFSRLGVYTGKGLGGLLREQFSVRSSFLALTLLVIANAGLTVSEFAGVGAAFQILAVSQYISVPEALAPVVGPAAPQLFAIGLLGASLLAASVCPSQPRTPSQTLSASPVLSPPASGRPHCFMVFSPCRSPSARE